MRTPSSFEAIWRMITILRTASEEIVPPEEHSP
jgi:hypothetical protein